MILPTTLKLVLLGATAQALALPTSYPSASSADLTPSTTVASASATATEVPASYLPSADVHFDDIYIDENGDLVSDGTADTVVEKRRISLMEKMRQYQAKQEKEKADRNKAKYCQEKAEGRKDSWDGEGVDICK